MTMIPGMKTTMLRLELPADTREALVEQGITPVPDHVILRLQAATSRERDRYAQRQSIGFKTEGEEQEWVTDLLMRRVEEGTQRIVVRELVRDLQPTQITLLLYAYVSGEAVEDPKAVEAIAQTMKSRMQMMALPILETLALAGRLPSLPTTTE